MRCAQDTPSAQSVIPAEAGIQSNPRRAMLRHGRGIRRRCVSEKPAINPLAPILGGWRRRESRGHPEPRQHPAAHVLPPVPLCQRGIPGTSRKWGAPPNPRQGGIPAPSWVSGSVIKSDQNEKSGHKGSYCIFAATVLAYAWGTITPDAGDKGANHRLRASRDTPLALKGAHDHVLYQMWKGEQRRRQFLRPMRCESESDAPATGTGEAVKHQEDSTDSRCRRPHSCPGHHDIDSSSCVGAQSE